MGFSKICVHIEDNKVLRDHFSLVLGGFIIVFSNIIIWTFTFKGGTEKDIVSTFTFI